MLEKPFTPKNLFLNSPTFNQQSIALFASKPSQSVKTFCDTFSAHLKRHYKITFTLDLFYASDEEKLAELLKNQTYSLLLSLGHRCTTRAKQIVANTQSSTPLIFSSINDSMTQQSQSHRITGVTTPLIDYASQMLLVLSYTPEIKKILVLYDNLDSQMLQVQKSFVPLLKEHGYIVNAQPHPASLTRQEMLNLAQNDMVILLNQQPLKQDIQRMANLCKEHKTILYITDTTSVMHGAAFGFGKDDASMARQAASLSYELFTNSATPQVATIPYRLKINLQALNEQGLALIKLAPLLSMINNTHVVHPSTQDKVAAYLRLEQLPLE